MTFTVFPNFYPQREVKPLSGMYFSASEAPFFNLTFCLLRQIEGTKKLPIDMTF